MSETWRRLNERFEALARRERIIIFAGTLFGVALLGYQFLVDPHLVREAALARSLATQQQALAQLQAIASGAAVPKAQDPNLQNRRLLETLRTRVAEVEAEYKGIQASLVPPDQVASLLESLLASNRGLHLVSLRTLAATPLLEPVPAKAADDRKTGTAPPAPADAGLYKHGVQITVKGSYSDILAYLSQLERLPQKVYWGRVALVTEEYPVSVLNLTVYTISLGKSWLVI